MIWNMHDKVKDIDDMPRPIEIEGVQRFNGFVNYLAKFLPKLSEVTKPIRLTREDGTGTGLPAKKMFFFSWKNL